MLSITLYYSIWDPEIDTALEYLTTLVFNAQNDDFLRHHDPRCAVILSLLGVPRTPHQGS